MKKGNYIPRQVGLLIGLSWLAGCAPVAPVIVTEPALVRNWLLVGVGLVVFGLTLLYAGVKAFLAFNEVTDDNNMDGRVQIIGFVVGLLLAVLVIAVDSAPTPLTLTTILTALPLIVLVVMGVFGGLFIGVFGAVMANLRGTSGDALTNLTLSFLSATGIYLILFPATPPGIVLTGFVSVLIGILIFRMMFPNNARETG
ncbi:MAG: hypothetical protein H6631_09075 [Anaerolineaceae bacterium]|nr:hypothetical protein [Anaerolineaceae bacterium]MCB9101058.1 hypothetical protein [Anaerolineales bacterium]